MIGIGDQAPEFDLPAASGSGSVSLGHYRGQSPVYLALFRGLYCSFCRRHVVHERAKLPRGLAG